jgi:uncharacterized membrane protein
LAGFRRLPRAICRRAPINEHQIHRIFQVSVLLKGAHALIECAGGVVLALVSTRTIMGLVDTLTQEELIEDPRDFIATHLLAWAHSFSIETKNFYAFYLRSHGAVKIFLVVGLLKNRLWSYPASLIALWLFVVYQLYRFSYTPWGRPDRPHGVRHLRNRPGLARVPAHPASLADEIAPRPARHGRFHKRRSNGRCGRSNGADGAPPGGCLR